MSSSIRGIELVPPGRIQWLTYQTGGAAESHRSVPDTPDTDKPAAVATQPDDLNATAGMRCVNHASTPEVDAHVTEAGEEEHVSRLHSPARYLTTAVEEGVRAVWDSDTESSVRPIDEA
jgi:hypothetical protein